MNNLIKILIICSLTVILSMNSFAMETTDKEPLKCNIDMIFFESIDNMSICQRRDVKKFVELYLTKWRSYTIRAINRSYRYSDIVEDLFLFESNLPLELSMLPLLESGFYPKAVSKSKAVGLWQFMNNTSKILGLKTDRWVDERRAIRKSTIAAIRHLRHLHRRFGSWGLALAAYNGGSTRVQKIIDISGAKNIWQLIDLGLLRQETHEYTLRFAALLLIYKNPYIYGISDELERENNIFADTELLKFDFPVNINLISKFSGISIELLKKYNPEIKGKYTPPYNKEYCLRIPSEKKSLIIKNWKSLYRFRLRRHKRYRVRKGDYISRIAKKYRRSVAFLMKYNGIKNPRRLRPGQIIRIPY